MIGPSIVAQTVQRCFRLLTDDSIYQYARRLAVRYYALLVQPDPDLLRIHRNLSAVDLSGHCGPNYAMEDWVAPHHLRVQLASLIRALQRVLGDGPAGDIGVLDVGDSDGIFLRMLGFNGSGVGLNIDGECARQIRNSGGAAVQGDAESLPFQENTFDFVFSLQTIMMLPNPIRALRELARVARRGVLLSMIYAPKTRFFLRDDSQGRIRWMQGVGFYSPEDFAKLLTHTPLEVRDVRRIRLLPEIRNPWHRFVLRSYFCSSYYPELVFYDLTKKANPVHSRTAALS